MKEGIKKGRSYIVENILFCSNENWLAFDILAFDNEDINNDIFQML